MIENWKESPEEFKDYDSEVLLKILNKTSFENKKGHYKELFVDENWKINSKIWVIQFLQIIQILKEYYRIFFHIKKMVIQDNNDVPQTIFLS